MVNQFLIELLVDCLVSVLVLLCRLRSRPFAQLEVRDVAFVLVLLLSLLRDVCEETGGII